MIHPTYPVIVIGAGPAGLAVAASLAAEGIHVLVLDDKPQIGGTAMELPDDAVPSVGIEVGHFRQALTETSFPAGMSFLRDRVTGITPYGFVLALETVNKLAVFAQHVVLAIGTRPIYQATPCCVGVSVGAAPLPLGPAKRIAIVGGGEEAIRAYLEAKQRGHQVRLFAPEVSARLSLLNQVDPADVVVGTVYLQQRSLKVNEEAFDHIRLHFGWDVPRSALLGTSVGLTKEGLILCDFTGRTSMDNVWACGEAVTGHQRISSAVHAGQALAKRLLRLLEQQSRERWVAQLGEGSHSPYVRESQIAALI